MPDCSLPPQPEARGPEEEGERRRRKIAIARLLDILKGPGCFPTCVVACLLFVLQIWYIQPLSELTMQGLKKGERWEDLNIIVNKSWG